MNIRLVLFSAIMTALAGAMIATAASKLGQPDFNRLRYESEFYGQIHNNHYPIAGAALGFVVGASQECIRQLHKKQLLKNKSLEKNLHL